MLTLSRSGNADSGGNFYPSLAFVNFSRTLSADSKRVGYNVARSPGIYYNLARFSINFNFSFPWLLKGMITTSSLPESQSESINPARSPYKGICVGVGRFDKTFYHNIFSKVLADCNETPISGPGI